MRNFKSVKVDWTRSFLSKGTLGNGLAFKFLSNSIKVLPNLVHYGPALSFSITILKQIEIWMSVPKALATVISVTCPALFPKSRTCFTLFLVEPSIHYWRKHSWTCLTNSIPSKPLGTMEVPVCNRNINVPHYNLQSPSIFLPLIPVDYLGTNSTLPTKWSSPLYFSAHSYSLT